MKNYEKISAAAFIAFNFGLFAAQIGKVLPESHEPVSAWVPILFLAMMSVPSALMYFAGKKDGQNGK